MKIRILCTTLLALLLLMGCSEDKQDTPDTTYDGSWNITQSDVKDSGTFTVTISILGRDTIIYDESMTLFDTSKTIIDTSILAEVAGDSLTPWFVEPTIDTTFELATAFEDWKQPAGVDSLGQIENLLPNIADIEYNSAVSTADLSNSTITKKLNATSDALTLTFEQHYTLSINFSYTGSAIPLQGTGLYTGIRVISYECEQYSDIIPPHAWPSAIETLTYEQYWERIISKQ